MQKVSETALERAVHRQENCDGEVSARADRTRNYWCPMFPPELWSHHRTGAEPVLPPAAQAGKRHKPRAATEGKAQVSGGVRTST